MTLALGAYLRRHGLLPILATAIWLHASAVADDAITRVMETPASRLEPGLPDKPLQDWLREQLPPGVPPVVRTGPCGAASGICVSIEANVVSRARTLRLECKADPPRFLGGTLVTHDGRQERPIRSLAALPDHLSAPLRPPPLKCPEGTRNVLRERAGVLLEWCQDPQGRKHGPARSWYSAGRQLMSRGRYRRDARVGRWVECDRSERCTTRLYQ